MKKWEKKFIAIIDKYESGTAHDIGHMMRVAKWAGIIGEKEGADMNVVIPAAWLHDLVDVPKSSPERSKASLFSASAAVEELTAIGYPEKYMDGIFHAVHAHSYSANIDCKTVEAKVLQDADRLELLGSMGIARTLSVGGALGFGMFDPFDPLAEKRKPDDMKYSVDHFYVKLFKLPEMLHTKTARKEAEKRVKIMHEFLKELKREAV